MHASLRYPGLKNIHGDANFVEDLKVSLNLCEMTSSANL